MSSTYLTRTISSATTPTKLTVSFWVKRSKLGATQRIITQNNNGGGNNFYWRFESNDKLTLWNQIDGSSTWADIQTNRKFRDTNAWYHICCMWDSTQSTEANRMKLYINGIQETDLSTNTYPSQNATFGGFANTTCKIDLGYYRVSDIEYFSGLLSHVHVTDGYAYNADTFGSTDATTGEWKINTSPSVTYGTNGFFILKDGNSGTDESSNSNDFTVGAGTLTKTEDNPSNVFATWNTLDGSVSLGNSDFQHGNTKFNSETSTNVCWARSTLGMTSGKFYFEFKVETIADHVYIGIADRASPNTSTYFGAGSLEYGYKSSSGEKKNNGTSTSYGNTWTTNDIISCAVDLDNLKIYFGKNGTWQNSGDPTSGSTGTGAAYTITAPSLTNNGAYFFCGADGTSSNKCRLLANFGNGYFGTTAVSSAGTNASGNGIFEYDVPTGYTALSTKGLNL